MIKNEFKSFGEFLSAGRNAQLNGLVDKRLTEFKATGHMSEVDDYQGGFFVPDDFANRIILAVFEESIVRPRAGLVLPMTRDRMVVPRIVETSRASTLMGGIAAVWLEEAGDKSSNLSKPAIGAIGLNAHKLVTSTWMSNELFEDMGMPAEQFFTQTFSKVIRFEEDDRFINGTGAGQPLGILNARCTISVAKDTGQDDLTISLANVTGMEARLTTVSHSTAIWLVHPTGLPQLRTLVDKTTGTNHFVETGMAGNVQGAGWLLGKPVIVTEKCQTLGTKGDIYLADFNAYIIGDRGLSIDFSAHTPDGFPKDETFCRVISRVDGQPVLDSPITPRYGTTTLSPFVTLDSRN